MSGDLMLLATGGVMSLHAAGSLRLAGRSSRQTGWGRSACGVAGFGLLLFLQSPWFHELGHALFTGHMVMHILLAAAAAPLLVMAEPLAPLLWSLPRGVRKAAGDLLTRPPLQRTVDVATTPLVAGMLHAVALWAWHVPAFYEAALENTVLHWLQHASLFVTALAFWCAALRARAPGAAILLLFVTLTHTGFLGALLALSAFPWYAGHAPEAWGLTPLEDQQLAGFTMWVPASFIYLGAALWAGARLLKDPPLEAPEQRA